MDERSTESGSASGETPDAAREMARQLAELAERLRASGQAGWSALNAMVGGTGPQPQSVLQAMLASASVPTRQLESVLQEIRARRDQINTLRTQLGVFEEQLGALETALQPVAEWGRAWLGWQQALLGPLGGAARGPGGSGGPGNAAGGGAGGPSGGG
jgi:hypothetical protein